MTSRKPLFVALAFAIAMAAAARAPAMAQASASKAPDEAARKQLDAARAQLDAAAQRYAELSRRYGTEHAVAFQHLLRKPVIGVVHRRRHTGQCRCRCGAGQWGSHRRDRRHAPGRQRCGGKGRGRA